MRSMAITLQYPPITGNAPMLSVYLGKLSDLCKSENIYIITRNSG